MGSSPHMALLPGVGPIQMATSRVLVPREVQVHRPPINPSLAHKTRRHHRSTGYRSTNHYSDKYKSVSHRSPVMQSPVTGQKFRLQAEVNICRSLVNQPPVISLYISLQLVILIPLAWSSKQLSQMWVLNTHTDMKFRTQQIRRVLLPLEPDFSNMSDPSVIIELPDNNWRSDNRQTSQTSHSGHVSRRD